MSRAGELDWGILSGSIGPRVRLLRNVLSARSITASASHRLPTGSLTILALVAANPGSSQIALAKRASINKSALVGILNELETLGLVAREVSEADRRRNGLRVTPDGERAMTSLFAAVTGEEGAVRDALGPGDLTQLLALLDRAIAAVD